MSKKVVLKSVFAMVMVGFILSFVSCQKDEKKIVGTWLLEKIEVKDFACSDPFVTAMVKPFVQQAMSGSGNNVEFTKEGKVIFSSPSESEVASYEVNDKKLTFIYNGYSETYDLSFPEKKTMQWDMNMDKNMLSELSEGLTYYFEEEIEITKCNIRYTLIKR